MNRRTAAPRRLLLLAAFVASFVLVPAAASSAKSPPRGSYTCQQFAGGTTGYAGTLRILKNNRYRVNGGKIGRFTMRGAKITWKTGVYKGLWRSKVRRAAGADRTLTIGHFSPKDRSYTNEQVSCYRDD